MSGDIQPSHLTFYQPSLDGMLHEETLHLKKQNKQDKQKNTKKKKKKPDLTAPDSVIQNKEHTSVLSILLQWQKDSGINQRRTKTAKYTTSKHLRCLECGKKCLRRKARVLHLTTAPEL